MSKSDEFSSFSTYAIAEGHQAKSGRLLKHIPIGKFRDRAQRIDRELLASWGGIEKADGEDWLDGYIQLSGAPPIFRDPAKFLKWFWTKRPKLVHANNV